MVSEKLNPKVTFVVPARNEQRHLESCLNSIRAQCDGITSYSVIVVDNESTDATVSIAERCGARVVRVAPGNPGRARNAGVAATESEFIAFIDADCVLPPDWLARGLQHLSDRRVVAVGSVQALAPADAPWVERTWVAAITPSSDMDWEPAEWLAAFNLLLRRRDFLSIGGFDESLTTCEDSDLGYRLAPMGELRRDFACGVRHLGESKSLGEFFRREMWRSQGNFRSAWRRRSIQSEFFSLFLPIAYLSFVILAIVSLMLAIAFGGWWWSSVFLTLAAVIAVPILAALLKCGHTQISSIATLLAIYLVARGLGPIVATRRVARR